MLRKCVIDYPRKILNVLPKLQGSRCKQSYYSSVCCNKSALFTLNIDRHPNLELGRLHYSNLHQYEQKSNEIDFVNHYTERTHTCGELRPEHLGRKVTLCGWVQFTRLSKFILLRDGYGITQCITESSEIDFANITLESVVKIEGTVIMRPKDQINTTMATGEVEVLINKLEILNVANKLPFNLREYQKPKEQLRLHHRYVDLRFPEMQHNLRLRSSILHNMRRFLVEKSGFVEVETPTLFCRTPGGAREFVVPTHHSGLFYSLVQSPQQFKQMLMSGAIDRYFQVARCYRDEATRSDRQPEFTQLDIELSFSNVDGVLSLIENLLYDTYPKTLPKPPFTRMTYKDAIDIYGSDKPNLNYDLKLTNIGHLFNNQKDDNFKAVCLSYPKQLGKLTTRYKQEVKDISKKYESKIVLNENIKKEFGDDVASRLEEMAPDSHSIVCVGKNDSSCFSLGEVRPIIASLLKERNLIEFKNETKILWVVDFPLFTKGPNGDLETCHHPFTAPHPEDVHLLETDPLKVRSLAYDLVINGNEVGGGSVRIHNSDLQEKVLNMLNIESEPLAHFLNALKCGCPPHAGIALGIDRLMVLACDAESLRDVIAFPKSHDGKDPLSGAPNPISDDDKKYYHLL